jgi:hypothetical protein
MIEVLKQMVKALEYHIEQTRPISKTKEAIQVGKQAIAELESQEPVAYLCEPDEDGLFDLPTPDKGCKDCFPVYRHPQRTWVGLAKEDRLCAKYMQDAPNGIEAVIDYIEAKLKEKNT